MSGTENIPKQNLSIPPMSEVPTYKSGPVIQKLRFRAITIYILMCVLGTLPVILNSFKIVPVPPWLQAAAMGLWFPGAGMLALGSIWGILLGVAMLIFVMKFGGDVWGIPAVVLIIIYLWVLSILGGALAAQNNVPWYSSLIIYVLAGCILISRSKRANNKHKEFLGKRTLHEEYFEEEAAKLESRVKEADPREKRELSHDAVKAARYMFDMTLREPGDFSGYESAEQILSSALRYSLDFLGYSLALMQCMYTPNFHGYLNRAQRFIIDSFTRPEVCGYWKWEDLSSLRWNPDPIRKMNIMFTGWSGLVINLYGANTGDLRYEEAGALKFKPFKNTDKTYNYNSKGIVDAIMDNWSTYVTGLFPCEPHLTFPQCNTFAMDAVFTYDRHHGSDNMEKIFPKLDKSLRENFILPSGNISFVHNTLIGFRSLEIFPERFDATNAFILSRILNAVKPGLTKRTYIFAMNDFTEEKDGEIIFKPEPWTNALDDGNFKNTPAYVIGIIAAAACEMGDTQIVDKILAVADKYMERLDDSSVLAYKKGSVIGNAHIVCARFAQKDDFYNMIHKGPGEGALKGPILTDCGYPDVLVARAMSDGDDLDLILYNGVEPGEKTLGIERLRPNRTYEIKQTKMKFVSDDTGKATVYARIDGRTELHIVPVQ